MRTDGAAAQAAARRHYVSLERGPDPAGEVLGIGPPACAEGLKYASGGEPDPDSVTRAALRAWALVHGLGQLLLDGQLDWLEEDPLGLAEAVLADTV